MTITPSEPLRLEDRSLEIPPFLQRTEDGGFRYPGMPVPLITAPVTITPMEQVGRNAWETAHDRRMRAKVAREVEEAARATSKEKSEERKAEKSAEKAQLEANKSAQRKVFLESFKWSF